MPDSRTALPGVFSRGVARRLLAIFLPAALLTGGVVLALYYLDRDKERALYEQAGTHLVDLQADIIRREVKTVESDLFFLADQAILADFLSGRQTRKEPLEKEYQLFCRHRGLYDQIRYLDAAGRERIRINYHGGRPRIVPEGELQSKANRYYFWGTMRLGRGQVFVSPLDLNVEHGRIERPLKPAIRFATPVFDRAGAKRGILVLNYLGAALIAKLKAVSVTFPGSTLLLNHGGSFLRGPTPQDEWGFQLGHPRTFATYYPEEWRQLVHLGPGQFRTNSGLFTARILSPGPPRSASPPAADGSDPDAADPALLVVSHIPPDVLDRRPTLLLRRLLVLAGVILLLVLALAWYLAYAGAVRRDHERRLAESEARLRTLSTQLLTAQEDERRRLSRDLHDELGQLVTAVTLDLQRASRAGDPPKVRDLIGRALRGTECLLSSIQEIAARVRPTLLDDLGLKDAVRHLLGVYERGTGIVPQAELRLGQQQVPAVVAENVYRILQEALTNVSKHARSAEVLVELAVAGGQVVLVVRDQGVGFAPEAAAGKGLGMLGMRERAELLGGTFVVKAAPGKGTEIQVTIPVPASAAHADGGIASPAGP
jgi:signal transduction histidine kinase